MLRPPMPRRTAKTASLTIPTRRTYEKNTMTKSDDTKAVRPWRMQEKTADGKTVEFSGTGMFDELLIENFLHLEWLDDETWYIRVGDVRITATMLDDERVEVDVLRGAYGEVRGKTETCEP